MSDRQLRERLETLERHVADLEKLVVRGIDIDRRLAHVEAQLNHLQRITEWCQRALHIQGIAIGLRDQMDLLMKEYQQIMVDWSASVADTVRETRRPPRN